MTGATTGAVTGASPCNPSDAPEAALEAILQRHPLHIRETARGSLGYRESRSTAGSNDTPPWILLHGIGSGSGSWAWQLQSLAGRARIIAWDAPGYGSSAPVARPEAGAYADALAALLDALDIRRCILVGHSLGALMAVAFASMFPERVAHMVLVAPAAGYGEAPLELRERVLRERIGTLEELGVQKMAASRSGRLLSPAASPAAHGWVRRNMAQLDPSGYRQAVALLVGESIAGHAARAAAPAAVIVGAADQVTPPDKCRRVAALWPGTPLRVLPDAGHALYIEAPDRFDTMLLDVLHDHALGDDSGANVKTTSMGEPKAHGRTDGQADGSPQR
jgi:pimeloyl-ACP methyl ester carboxylesterase